MRPTAAAFITILLAGCSVGLAQDADQDGLPDAVEERLGTNREFAEALDVLITDKTKEEGDRVGTDNYAPGLDITAVALGNVAQDRWLWRVDFLDEVAVGNIGLIIYIQADNDETTGRQDVRGIDYMLTFSGGQAGIRAFEPDGTEKPLPANAAVLGNSLYLCADLSLHQEDGKTRCSAHVLLETRDPYKMVDTVGSFNILAQGESDRDKPRTIADLEDSEGLVVTWGLDLQREARSDPANVVLPIQDCEAHGFGYDNFTEYHMPSVRIMGQGPFTIEATAPKAGRYYPAFIAYDDAGRQVYTLALNGRRLGIAVAKQGNRRQAFFAAAEPVEVKQGDVLKLELVRREGYPRVEDLFLLAELPELRSLPREIRHLNIDRLSGRVTFITTWPVKAKFEYGPDEEYGTVVQDKEPEANHGFRAQFGQCGPGKVYYRLSGETPEGDPVVIQGTTESWRQAQDKRQTPDLSGLADRVRVPLTVRNEHDAAVSGWPITQGIPIPVGRLACERLMRMRMLGPSGDEIPLQAQVQTSWPDGSAKWVLLDFQADLPANSEQVYTLEYGTRVTPIRGFPRMIHSEFGAGGIDVDARRLQIKLATGAPETENGIWLDSNGDGEYSAGERVCGGRALFPARVMLGDKVAVSDAKPVYSFSRLEGPLHTVVGIGRYVHLPDSDAVLRDECRIHAYSGKPFIRLMHTWTNSNASSEWSDIQSWDLVSAVDVGDRPTVTVGGHGAQHPCGAEAFGVDQSFDNAFRVTNGTAVVAEGERAPGWIDLVGSGAGVTVAVRNFWQLYPKRLTARLDEEGRPELTIGIMPRFAPGTYQVSKEGELEDKLYYYLKDDAYRLRQGMSKRHELLLSFRQGDAPLEAAVAAATVFQRPPVAVAPPEWYCDSGAFTDTLPSSTELGGIYKAYEQATRKSLDAYLSKRETGREYGMLNFGDWWGERGRNWGNIEYDTQHAFYLQFIRSGDADFFYAAEEACRHNMDVDMVRAHSTPSRVGCVYAHCIGHVGGYYNHKINDQGSPNGGFTITHTWVDGYLDNYCLTGDLRGRDSAQMVAQHYNSYYLRNYDYNNDRTCGWHLVATLAMYRATRDPYHLNAARIIMERVKEREMPEGGWTRQLMPGHCHCLPRHRGEAAFMAGVLLTSLKDYHEITGDQDVADMLVRGAKNIIEETWVPQQNGMRYTSCPNTGPSVGLSTLVTEGILYAYSLSGDPEIGEVALAGTLEAGARVNGFGKSFSQQTRVTPHYLHQQRALRLTETALVLDDEPLTAYIKRREGTPFDIVLRPREDAGVGTAILQDPTGKTIAEVALDPQRSAVSLSEGITAVDGAYRLQLSGGGTWGIDTYLNPMVIDASRPIVLGAQPAERSYFVAPGQKVAMQPAVAGSRVGDVYAAPLESARNLVLYRVPANTPARLNIEGGSTVFAPWSQFWFDPGQPTASIKATWSAEAGKAIILRLDVGASTDPDGTIANAFWSVDGKPVGEGLTFEHPLESGGQCRIGLRVVDDSGLEATASSALRLPPRWLLDLDSDRYVLIEAEQFTGQSGGQVKLYERFSSGKMLTYWHANLGHTLTWTADVPRAGTYYVAVKYCTDSKKAMRDLKIDGKHPAEGFAQFHLPRTGGFSTGTDNWQYVRLGEWAGAPWTFKLSAGKHEISMSNLGEGCALDQLFVIPVD